MMKRIAVASLAFALSAVFCSSALAENKKKVIAVGQPGTSVACLASTRTLAESMMASLRTRLTQTGLYQVVNERQMTKILKQHEKAMVGLVDPNTAKTLGQFLQADLMLSVEFLCFEDHKEMNVHLTNVETGIDDWATTYSMLDMNKTRRALKDLTAAMVKYAKTGSVKEMGGKTRLFQVVDARAFHDSAEYIVDQIRYAIPNVRGSIQEINVYGDSLKVKVASWSGYDKPWAGLRFKVERDGEEIGWLYLKKKGGGVIEAGTNDDMSSFEEGDLISSRDYEPTVAIGNIEDEEEGEELDFLEFFKERMLEFMQEKDGLTLTEDKKALKILQRMGPKVNKKDLAKLHKAGVDLLIVGRFQGVTGKRRIDFDVLSTYDGKKVIRIKRENIGL